MIVKFWGCRGSVPVCGSQFLKYGGSSTCVEIRLSNGTIIIIDAGTGIRNLGRDLMRRNISREIYLYLTHSHWDHLMGFPFFAPAYSPDWKLFVRGGPIAKSTLHNYFEHTMEPPYFPARMSKMKAEVNFTNGIPIETKAGGAVITPIPLSHPNGGWGFKIAEKDKTVVFLTDNELGFQHQGGLSASEYRGICRKATLILHDAQYTDTEYKSNIKWGHSTFSSAVELGIHSEAKMLGLIHHDPDHTDPDIDLIENTALKMIDRANSKLQCFAAFEGQEIRI